MVVDAATVRLISTLIALVALTPGTIAHAEDVLIQDGIDSAPYSFIPSLPRGLRDTQYLFSGEDDDGVHHDFRTFVRFDLPEDLLGPDETVLEAYAWVYYSFDFGGFGDASKVPGEMHCHEVLGDWQEHTLTWVNQPAYGPAFDAHPDIEDLGLLWCDASELVRRWATGATPNYGIALTNATERLIGTYSFEAFQVDPNFRPSLVVSVGPSEALDLDSDGIADPGDNCPHTANPAQQDSNGDGFGDACAFELADLDADGLVDGNDRRLWRAARGSVAGEPGYDPACDLDENGRIDAADQTLYAALYSENFTGGMSCGLIGIEVGGVLAVARRRRRRHTR